MVAFSHPNVGKQSIFNAILIAVFQKAFTIENKMTTSEISRLFLIYFFVEEEMVALLSSVLYSRHYIVY